jgi:rhamnosyl/mannosyltransferase
MRPPQAAEPAPGATGASAMKVLHAGIESSLKTVCEAIHGTVEVEVAATGNSLGTALELFGRFRETVADVVHIHDADPTAILAYLASGCRKPLVIQYHQSSRRGRRLSNLFRRCLRPALHRAEAVVVPSAEVADASPEMKAFRHKCVVIPVGIELEPLLAIEREPASDHTQPLILALGPLGTNTGFTSLIEAIERVNGRLVIVGDGERRATLEAQIQQLGLEGRIRMAGYVSRQMMLTWYSRADVFCVPACEEGEPVDRWVREAMAAGLPVVGTMPPSGVQTVNVNGETGFVVRPGDTIALADALDLLASHPDLRGRMAAAARRKARQEFGRELMGRRIVGVYRDILGRLGAHNWVAEYALSRH